MVFSYCKCSYHLAGNENAAANFYNTHFVPDGWELVYSKLSECRSIHLKGRCKDCYGDLNEMIPLPEGLSGDALFQAIYDAMWSAHPYDAILEHIGCHGPCEERSAFYCRRDKTSQFRRNAKFLELIGPVQRWFHLRRTIYKDKEHCYFKCPHCGQQLRVPRGRGKITVTCRSCGASFQEKS